MNAFLFAYLPLSAQQVQLNQQTDNLKTEKGEKANIDLLCYHHDNRYRIVESDTATMMSLAI